MSVGLLMAAQGTPPANLPTAQPPGARSGGGQRSPQERIKAEAGRAAAKLMPGAPDGARIAVALTLAGSPTDPASEFVTPCVSRAAEAYQAWQPTALENMAGAIQRGAMASPGSCLTPRACPAIFAAWDAGLAFEQQALDEACVVLNVDATAANLARTLLRSSQSAALCSVRSLHGELDPEADLLTAALQCAGDDAAAAAHVRAALVPYEEDRARLVRAFAEAEVRTQSRNAEVAMAIQTWAAGQRNSDNANQHTAPIEGVAMVAMVAPTIEAGRNLMALHIRGAQALEAAVPGEVAWCAYVWLVDPAAATRACQVMTRVREVAAAVSPERAATISALAGDFRAAELAKLKAASTARLAEDDKTIATLQPFLGTGPITAAAVEQVAAALTASPGDQARQNLQEVRSHQRERMDAFETQVRAIADVQ